MIKLSRRSIRFRELRFTKPSLFSCVSPDVATRARAKMKMKDRNSRKSFLRKKKTKASQSLKL
jgi:hypothetical protein